MLWLMISILFSLLSIKMLISQCRNLLSINDNFNAKCLKKERETGKQRKNVIKKKEIDDNSFPFDDDNPDDLHNDGD